MNAAELIAAVQRNSDIADARHAADLTLCIYLLQMRELYRWQQGLPLGAPLVQAEVGAWLDRREALWDELADADYGALPFGDDRVDAFDTDGANARLRPHGLTYGAGRLASGRPVFFIGELLHEGERDGLPVRVAARELARGVAALPAVFDGRSVLLRRDALLRWLWELHELRGPRREAHAFGAALAGCGGATPAAIERLADLLLESLLLHELGERSAGVCLGPDWPALRVATGGDRRIEPRLRALRDHLADCLVTLPTLLERGATPAIHFWFATLEGPRAEMFPRIAAAYADWCAGDGGRALQAALATGRGYWQVQGEQAIDVYRRHRGGCHGPLARQLAELRC